MMQPVIITRSIAALFITVALFLLSACSTLQKTPPQEPQTLRVTATAFNTHPKQGQGNADRGAWGDRITPGMYVIAVSADLLPFGLKRGAKVRIEGLRNEYVVLDRMPPKWNRRIDVYMGNDIKAARSWGRREVTISWTPAQ